MRHGWSVNILQIQPVRYDGKQSLAPDCQGKQWKEKKRRISDEHREARSGRQPLAKHYVVRRVDATLVSRNSRI